MACRRYACVLKWLTTALLACAALLFVVRVPWIETLAGALIPRLPDGRDALVTLPMVFGTTISPHLSIRIRSADFIAAAARQAQPV